MNKLANCPLNAGLKGVHGCIWGTSGGETYFQAGNLTVHFTKSIILQGGEYYRRSVECTEEDKTIYWECGPGGDEYFDEQFLRAPNWQQHAVEGRSASA